MCVKIKYSKKIIKNKKALFQVLFLKIKGDVVLLVTGVKFVTNIINNITMNFVHIVNLKCFI